VGATLSEIAGCAVIPSYGKIWNMGHVQLTQLFDGPVLVQEKIDGSYFAFGIIDGRLQARSKGQAIDLDAPDKMFALGAETVKCLEGRLKPGYVYCGEYLNKPKHNTLAYDRTPLLNVVLFDVETEPRTEKWLSPEELAREAERIGLELVPSFEGKDWTYETLAGLLTKVSCLGGQTIEGLVVKNYNRFGIDGKVLRGKYVSEVFKEVNGADWKKRHPAQADIKLSLALAFRTPARWNKAIHHLREAGQLTDTPKDIGPLLKEINQDVLTECSDEIKERLFKWAWKDLSRELTKGFPEYYKQKLLEKQFDDHDCVGHRDRAD